MSTPTQDRYIARVAEIERDLDRAERECLNADSIEQMREAFMSLVAGTGRLLTLVCEETERVEP
jgi:hypothetical protein